MRKEAADSCFGIGRRASRLATIASAVSSSPFFPSNPSASDVYSSMPIVFPLVRLPHARVSTFRMANVLLCI
jgi:hypothetical protein